MDSAALRDRLLEVDSLLFSCGQPLDFDRVFARGHFTVEETVTHVHVFKVFRGVESKYTFVKSEHKLYRFQPSVRASPSKFRRRFKSPPVEID